MLKFSRFCAFLFNLTLLNNNVLLSQYFQMHHTMDGLDMLDPAGSMTTLTPMSDTPITSSHHQLHGSYHGMNHMMGHHHGGPLGGHTPGRNHYGKMTIIYTYPY